MNSVDYSRKLDLERANYRQKTNENSRQTDEYKKDLKANYDERVANLRENNRKQKSDLESQFKDSYDNLDRQSKDALLEKQLTFNKKVADDRQEFNEIRKENSTDFNRRFKVLKDSYTSSYDDLKESNQERFDNQQDIYNQRIADNETGKESKLSALYDKQRNDTRDLTENYRKEKDQIINDKDNAMSDLVKEEQKRRNFIKDTAVSSVEKMRNEQDESLRNARITANRRFKDSRINTDIRIKDLDERNSEKVNEITMKSKSDIETLNKEFQKKFADQALQNRQNLKELDFRNKVNGVGEESANFDILKKTRENQQASEERRIDILKTQKDNIEQTYAKRESDNLNQFQDKYRDMRIELSGELQKQERELATINNEDRYRNIKKMAKDNDAYTRGILEERNNAAKEVGEVKRQAREMRERRHKIYANNLSETEFLAEARVKDVQKTNVEDKTAFMKRAQKDFQEERDAQKKAFTEKFDKMENSYQEKVLALENKNSSMKNQYENKMQNLIQKTRDDIARQTKEMKIANDNQLKLERENNNAKLKQLRESIAIQRATSDKTLNELNQKSDQKMSNLTYSYEKKLKDQEEKFKNIIDQNLRKAEIDRDVLKLASAEEKEALIEQYEQKLDRMESINNQKLVQMEKYAGLSISQRGIS